MEMRLRLEVPPELLDAIRGLTGALIDFNAVREASEEVRVAYVGPTVPEIVDQTEVLASRVNAMFGAWVPTEAEIEANIAAFESEALASTAASQEAEHAARIAEHLPPPPAVGVGGSAPRKIDLEVVRDEMRKLAKDHGAPVAKSILLDMCYATIGEVPESRWTEALGRIADKRKEIADGQRS